MRTILGACALIVALAAPAAAQDHGAMAMEMHPGAHAALMHRQELGLSAEQVARLTAIDSGLAATMRAHCQRVRAAGGPNAQTHAAMHGEMMAAMNASQQQSDAVLTARQRASLDSLHAAHHGAMAGHDMAAMHHGSAAAAGHDMAAMHHDSAGMAAMHAQMHGGTAPACSANGACTAAECADCCEHMGCCTPAAAPKPNG
ncbi:hypothetical protein [Longimicrobium sp.]|uniref:hypothetical protein n=1 Tax=Longimicrobium sp. TaxID=2029185 RepID=UPI002BD19A37|nr:hypothetical protein [Longimicrobium sp.]HSU15423.1 hypothetical protein [Longimicrobium sp.]